MAARRPVAWVVAANAIPDAAPSPEFLRKLDELEPNRNPPKKWTIEERQKLLLGVTLEGGPIGQVEGMAPGVSPEVQVNANGASQYLFIGTKRDRVH